MEKYDVGRVLQEKLEKHRMVAAIKIQSILNELLSIKKI